MEALQDDDFVTFCAVGGHRLTTGRLFLYLKTAGMERAAGRPRSPPQLTGTGGLFIIPVSRPRGRTLLYRNADRAAIRLRGTPTAAVGLASSLRLSKRHERSSAAGLARQRGR
jgi:hypothetical protein